MNQQAHIDTANLAALFDGELSRLETESLKQHLSSCPSCSAVLENMALTRDALKQLSEAPAIDDMWPCIEVVLDQEDAVVRRASLRRWAVAASIALFVGIAGLFAAREGFRDDDGSRLPVVASAAPIDFGLYLASLDHVGEMPALPPGFKHESTSTKEALNAIGITDGLNLDQLPADVSFRSAAVITHGSATIVQLTFEHNGETLVVLCQRNGDPVSFGRFPVTTTFVGKRKCLSAYCGAYRALCLTTRKGTFAVLGPTRNARLASLLELVASV